MRWFRSSWRRSVVVCVLASGLLISNGATNFARADPDEGMMQAYLIFGSWLCSGFCYGPYCCLVRLMA